MKSLSSCAESVRSKLFRGLLVTSLAAASVVLASANSASANVITETATLPTQTASFSVPFTVPAFDPSLGNLTNVTVELKSVISPSVSLIQFAAGPLSYSNATAITPVELSAPASYTINESATASSSSGTLTGSAFSITNIPDAPVTDDTTIPVASADFASYEGVSPLNFTFSTPAGTYGGSTTTPGTVAFSGAWTADMTTTVTYTFTPVPEPASLGLLAAGSLLLLRRRKTA